MKTHRIAIAGILFFLFIEVVPSFALQYSITDLGLYSPPDFGLFGTTPLVSYKINNSSQIAGHSPEGAFLWENGKITDLGSANIGGINDNGTVAGHDAEGIFIWENGIKRYTSRETEFYYKDYVQVMEINNLNQISGADRIDGWENFYAYLWDDATRKAVRIGTYSYDCLWGIATSVNDLGQTTVNLYDDLFLWENGVLTEIMGYAWLSDINNRGQIAGGSITADGLSHAVLWEDSIIYDIGGLEGYANTFAWSINESGQAVGSSFNDIYMFSDGSAFYWDSKTGMINLNDYISPDSGWHLAWASDINDLGYIVGIGIFNGETRGFLATPTPEPATMILLGTGLIGLAGIRRKSGRHPGVQNP